MSSCSFLRAFNQPVPESWELAEEQEANQAAGEVDYCLEEQLDEMGFEARDLRDRGSSLRELGAC